MMFMSPTILCILAYLGMVVEAVSRGSLPPAITGGQLCFVFMVMAGLLPIVQANHDFAVELLDSDAPILSHRQPEESSGALVVSATDGTGTRVDEDARAADLCATTYDAIVATSTGMAC